MLLPCRNYMKTKAEGFIKESDAEICSLFLHRKIVLTWKKENRKSKVLDQAQLCSLSFGCFFLCLQFLAEKERNTELIIWTSGPSTYTPCPSNSFQKKKKNHNTSLRLEPRAEQCQCCSLVFTALFLCQRCIWIWIYGMYSWLGGGV